MSARLVVTTAGMVPASWCGRSILIGTRPPAVLLAVQQWPTAHRTILTLGDATGVATLDVRADTTVATDHLDGDAA